MNKPNSYSTSLPLSWGLKGLLVFMALLAPSALDDERVLIKMMAYQPASLDPIYGSTGVDTVRNNDLFESLMGFNDAGDVVYAAAESLKVSDDGKRYHFRLRKGLQWSDGHPLTAQDFKTSVERLVDPANSFNKQPVLMPHVVLLQGAEAIINGRKPLSELGVEVLNEREIVFQLTRPSIFFEKLAARRLYPSPTHLIGNPGKNWPLQLPQVSNGPYYLSEIKSDVSYLLKKNPHYRYRDQLFFDSVHLLWGGKLEAGDIIKARLADVVYDYPFALGNTRIAEQFQYKPHYGEVGGGLFMVVFNTEDTLLNKLRLRRALQLATDSEQMINRLRKHNPSIRTAHDLFQNPDARQAPAIQPAWAGWSRQQRIDRAKLLLQQEGYNQDNPLKLTIRLMDLSVSRLLVNALKSQWQPLGIEVQTLAKPGGEHYRDIMSGSFQLAVARRKDEFNDPLEWLELLADQSNNNLPRWQSPEYQSLVKALSLMPAGKPRDALIQQAQQMILDAAPLLPLFTADISPVLIRDDIAAPRGDTHLQSRFIRRVSQHLE